MSLSTIPAAVRPTGAQMVKARARLADSCGDGAAFAVGYLGEVVKRLARGGSLNRYDVAVALAALEVER